MKFRYQYAEALKVEIKKGFAKDEFLETTTAAGRGGNQVLFRNRFGGCENRLAR